jgi:hypothetical protein
MISSTFIASINVSRYSVSLLYAKGPYNIKEIVNFQIYGATSRFFEAGLSPPGHCNEPMYENIPPQGYGNKKPSAVQGEGVRGMP